VDEKQRASSAVRHPSRSRAANREKPDSSVGARALPRIRPLGARLELGALGYWNPDDTSGGIEAGVAVRFSWSINAGLGAYF